MMESVWRTNIHFPANRRKIRLWLSLLVGISTFFGFLAFYDMHLYMPWHRRTLKALAMTFEAHSGLWLATLQIRSRWRFLVAALLIPSAVGVYLLLWNHSRLTGMAAAMGLIWLVHNVVWGHRLDD